ncbi:hypothetical protein R5W23_000270 [Gemmata sp. JC673]|uniref:Uncharacterized protein n=1 Tax=Gemmata algarum TaxID=2975278 RepID=A0ABU5EVG9_9BACT|nr:hypothetical protein [Gemmata algarum]MDY3559296.1 hypothetical protein [Gemmata algarum]
MDDRRKNAYRYLLYWAMLNFRTLQGAGPRGWRSWSPIHWRREARWVRFAGTVADALHNLAVYSSVNFRGFDEEWFWRDVETVRSRFPEFASAVGYYRELFERRISLIPDGSKDAEPGAAPDTAG